MKLLFAIIAILLLYRLCCVLKFLKFPTLTSRINLMMKYKLEVDFFRVSLLPFYRRWLFRHCEAVTMSPHRSPFKLYCRYIGIPVTLSSFVSFSQPSYWISLERKTARNYFSLCLQKDKIAKFVLYGRMWMRMRNGVDRWHRRRQIVRAGVYC